MSPLSFGKSQCGISRVLPPLPVVPVLISAAEGDFLGRRGTSAANAEHLFPRIKTNNRKGSKCSQQQWNDCTTAHRAQRGSPRAQVGFILHRDGNGAIDRRAAAGAGRGNGGKPHLGRLPRAWDAKARHQQMCGGTSRAWAPARAEAPRTGSAVGKW